MRLELRASIAAVTPPFFRLVVEGPFVRSGNGPAWYDSAVFCCRVAACALVLTAGSVTSRGGAQDMPAARDLSVRPAFAEPVVLATKDARLK